MDSLVHKDQAKMVTEEFACASSTNIYRFKIDDVYCALQRPEGCFVSLPSDKGLYDLINEVFRAVMTPLCDDDIISHLWSVSLYSSERGDTFHGPFHHRKPECSEMHPRNLCDLSLSVGATGRFESQSGSFAFKLVDVRAVEASTSSSPSAMEALSGSSLPSVERLAPSPWSTNVITDFLTSEEMDRAMTYRDAFAAYMAGDNAWKRCHKSERERESVTGNPHHIFVAGKPESFPWGCADNAELTLLILLLKSGAKFKRSWESILKYGLPRRTQAATSMKWYQLRKEDLNHRDSMSSYFSWTSRVVRGKSSGMMILDAKRIARNLMQAALADGIPVLGPPPFKDSHSQWCRIVCKYKIPGHQILADLPEECREKLLQEKPWLQDGAANKKARTELLGDNSDSDDSYDSDR
jgi:hypothetical protein